DRAAPPAVRLPSHLNAFRVAKDTRRLSVDPEWTASSGLGGFRRPRTDGGKAGLCGTGPGMRCRPLWEGRQPADRLPVVPLLCGCRAGSHVTYMARDVKSKLVPEVPDSPFPLDGEGYGDLPRRGLVAVGRGWRRATAVALSPPSKLR